MAPISAVRFMQLALATTILFSMVYMWEFFSMSASYSTANGRTLDAVNGSDPFAAAAAAKNLRLVGQTRFVVQGFEAGYKFVSEYNVETQGPLYILFMSDADVNGTYWCPDCAVARKPVYDAFERAPLGTRIVEIRVGQVEYWADQMNEFRQNKLFYIDYIPTLMRYTGGGNSTTMLTEKYCLDKELLDVVFQVAEPSGPKLRNNQIVTLTTPEAVIDFVYAYDNSYPLFIYFTSGFHWFNGRLWCPFCDRANVAIMHYYNTTAPDSAVLLQVVVADSYVKWKKKKHPFKLPAFREKVISLRGVPYLGRVHKVETGVKMAEFAPDFAETAKLTAFFQT